MHETNNTLQYGELQDNELELVSGGESWLVGLVNAIIIRIGCMPPQDVMNLVDTIGSSIPKVRRE